MNLEKEFIPYEQALALKELGFDEECLGTYYEEDKSFYINGVSYSNSYFTKAQELIPEHPQITTPLYQQAFRWFREKYELTSEVCIEQYRRKTNKKWMFSITYLNEDAMYEHSKTTFENYEEAELECLKRLIQIVKEK